MKKTARTARASLSPREQEVLDLVARGRTNSEIASSLVMSVPTASRHVHNILAKLGCANRTEAAARAWAALYGAGGMHRPATSASALETGRALVATRRPTQLSMTLIDSWIASAGWPPLTAGPVSRGTREIADSLRRRPRMGRIPAVDY